MENITCDILDWCSVLHKTYFTIDNEISKKVFIKMSLLYFFTPQHL